MSRYMHLHKKSNYIQEDTHMKIRINILNEKLEHSNAKPQDQDFNTFYIKKI